MSTPPIEKVKQIIKDNGYWVDHDAAMGKHVAPAHAGPYNASSREAVNLCKAVAFENSFVRAVIESHFNESYFNFFRIARPTSESRTILAEDDFRILVITAWSRRSRATLYAGSHKVPKATEPAKNGFLKVSRDSLTNPSIKSDTIDFIHGGLTIMDARVAFDVEAGTAVCLGFMIKDEVINWLGIPVPEDLQDIMELQTDKIKFNYTFHSGAKVNCLICTVFKLLPQSECTICSGTGVDYQ